MRQDYAVRVTDEQRPDGKREDQDIGLNIGTTLSEDDAEFAAAMDEVLEAYARLHDQRHPVLCMDEQSVQLTRQTRAPVEPAAAHADRVDHEYERVGTAAVFLFTEPLAGWRAVTARPRRTKADWAEEEAALLEGRYAHCQRVTLVCDSRNTHTKGAFYTVFEPGARTGAGAAHRIPLHAEARELAERREERTERPDAPMHARAADRGLGGTAPGDRGLGQGRQRAAA